MTLSPSSKALLSAAFRRSGYCANHPIEPRPKAEYLWHAVSGIAFPLCAACMTAWSEDESKGRSGPLMVEKIGD